MFNFLNSLLVQNEEKLIQVNSNVNYYSRRQKVEDTSSDAFTKININIRVRYKEKKLHQRQHRCYRAYYDLSRYFITYLKFYKRDDYILNIDQVVISMVCKEES